jgi:hypothetical protein
MILMLLSNEDCRRSNVDLDKLQFGIRSLTVAVLIGRSSRITLDPAAPRR